MLADILGYVSKNPTSIGSLKVDIVKTVTYNYEQDAPAHPVEKGYEINDTIINKPLKIEMQIGISSHPITWFWRNGRGVQKFSDGVKALMAIRDAKMPVTIVRPNDVITDMVMTSCKYAYSSESKSVMIVDLAFVKIVKVETATTEIPQDIVDKSIKDSVDASPKAGGAVAGGSVASVDGKAMGEEVSKAAQDALGQIWNGEKSVLYTAAEKAGLVKNTPSVGEGFDY